MIRTPSFDWSRRTMFSAIVVAALISTGCTTNYLTNSTNGTYGVPVTERTIPQRLLDRSIEHTAKINAYALDPNLQQTSRMSIDSFYSEVLLSGEVPTEAIKAQVEQVISSMPDVRHIYNELSVGVARGYSSTVQDGYITSKLMAKAVASEKVKSSQIKMVSNNGLVYVMGHMTPTQQSLFVDIANDTAGVTELVLLTKLVNDQGAPIGNEDIMSENNLDNSTEGAQITAPLPTVRNTVAEQPSSPSVSPTSTTSSSPYIELYKDQLER